MANLTLPTPTSVVQDQLNAIIAAILANPITPPNVVLSSVGGASGNFTYVVVARSNGQIIPSASASTTSGPTTLSATTYNKLTWNPVVNGNTPVVYDVYRTAGGTNQGLIASGLQFGGQPVTPAAGMPVAEPALPVFLDTGISATSATTPPFNTSATLQASEQANTQPALVNGAITIASGRVPITKAGVAALTLAQPIAGPASAGGHDGCALTIYDTTGHAHTVTTSANGINGADHIATFGGAVGNSITLQAYNGVWYATALSSVTLS